MSVNRKVQLTDEGAEKVKEWILRWKRTTTLSPKTTRKLFSMFDRGPNVLSCLKKGEATELLLIDTWKGLQKWSKIEKYVPPEPGTDFKFVDETPHTSAKLHLFTPPSTPHHFIERDSALRQYSRFLDQGLLIFMGPSGSGKSTLANKVLSLKSKEAKTTAAWLRCAGRLPEAGQLVQLLSTLVAPQYREEVEQKGFSFEREDFVRWFPSSGTEHYIVLDDVDDWLEGTNSITSDFLSACFAMPTSLKLILTYKSATATGILNTIISNGRVHPIELESFSTSECKSYLEAWADAGLLCLRDPVRLSALAERCPWRPFLIELVCEELRSEQAKQLTGPSRAQPGDLASMYLDGIVNDMNTAFETLDDDNFDEGDQTQIIENMVLKRFERFKDIPKEEGASLYHLALAIAVSHWYDGSQVITPGQLAFLTGDSEEQIARGIQTFRTLGLFPINSEEIRFKHGKYLQHAYNHLVPDHIRPEALRALQRRSAEWHAMQEDRNGNPKRGELEAWHRTRCEDYSGAWEVLEDIDRDMCVVFNYAQLGQLREGLAGKLSPSQQAASAADLAEVYYQGLDRWDEAENLVAEVIKNADVHGNIEASIQATVLMAILNFENGDSQSPIDLIRPFRQQKIDDKGVLANVESSLGVFFNRKEEFAEAEKAYRNASKLLESLEGDLNDLKDQIDQEYSTHPLSAAILARIERNIQYTVRDQIRVASNLSRTILFSRGPAAAIKFFKREVEDWIDQTEEKSSQEYAYASLNMSYFCLCAGEFGEATTWFELSSSPPEESWLKATREKHAGLIAWYAKGDEVAAVRHFEKVCPEFLGLVDRRGQMFAAFNATAAQMCRYLKTKEMDLNERTLQGLNLAIQLAEHRMVAGMKQFPTQEKIITYVANKFESILRDKYGVEVTHLPSPKTEDKKEKWGENWQKMVEMIYGDNMTAKSPHDNLDWRPPSLMPGLLVLRSKPFAPTSTEINFLKNQVEALGA